MTAPDCLHLTLTNSGNAVDGLLLVILHVPKE